MFDLISDIDYVIASVCILITVFVFTRKKFSHVSSINRDFYSLLSFVLVACVLDIVLEITLTYTDTFSYLVPEILRLLFNISVGTLAFMAYRYIKTFNAQENNKKTALDYIGVFMILVYVTLGVINIFTGIISYIDENGKHVWGPFYFVNYMVPVFCVFFVLLTVVKNRRTYTKDQLRAIVAMLIIIIVCIAVEYFVSSKVLLSMFGITLAVLIMQLSLETPDYQRFLNTLEELNASNAALSGARSRADELRKLAERSKIEAEAAAHELEEAKGLAEREREAADEARIKAELANKSRSNMITSLSYDVQAPINIIMSKNELIKKETTDAAIAGYADEVMEEVRNLSGILSDILEFAKTDGTVGFLKNVEYPFGEVIFDECENHREAAFNKGIKFDVELDENIPDKLMGDAGKIAHIISALTNEAIKHTDSGSVKVKITNEALTEDETILKFTVIDTGGGLSEDDMTCLRKIYDEEKINSGLRIQGASLGVCIASKYIRLMGSELTVDSVYGLGSRFSFLLTQGLVK